MTSLLLAFGFAEPWLLWGLLLGAIPLLIHLLHRPQYRPMPWAAMRFLQQAVEKHRQRSRWEQWLLLLVRAGILMALAIAFARPDLGGTESTTGSRPPLHTLFIFDVSLSTSAQSARGSRLDEFRQLALDQIQRAEPGDSFQLMTLGDRQTSVIIERPTTEASRIREAIQQLTSTAEIARPIEGVTQAETLLKLAPRGSRQRVVVLSDRQRSNFATSTSNTTLSEKLEQLGQVAEILWEPAEIRWPDSVGIVGLTVDPEFQIARRPVQIQATLRRTGSSSDTEVPVELLIDSKVRETRRIAVPIGAETPIVFSPWTAVDGSHRIEVRIPADGFTADDRRFATVQCRGEISVLLVNGKISGTPFGNATDFLELALNPAGQSQSPIRTTVVKESDWLRSDLSRYQIIALCDVARFTELEARELKRFAESGGGILMSLGSQVQIDEYNRALGPTGAGLLTVKLDQRVGQPAAADIEGFEFDLSDLSHPILNPFRGNPGSGLELTRTFAYIRSEIPANSTAIPVLKFTNGDAALIEMPVALGRLILFTTAFQPEWSTWAVWPQSLVPIVHETCLHLVRSQRRTAATSAGQSPVAMLPIGTKIDEELSYRTPSGTTTSMRYRPDFVLPIAAETGFYELRRADMSSGTQWIAVNPDPAEFDPQIEPLENLQPTSRPPAMVGGVSSNAIPNSSRSVSRLLILVVGLIVIEPILAWRFIIGATALTIWGLGIILWPW